MQKLSFKERLSLRTYWHSALQEGDVCWKPKSMSVVKYVSRIHQREKLIVFLMHIIVFLSLALGQHPLAVAFWCSVFFRWQTLRFYGFGTEKVELLSVVWASQSCLNHIPNCKPMLLTTATVQTGCKNWKRVKEIKCTQVFTAKTAQCLKLFFNKMYQENGRLARL